jgi:hypothetical protein
MVRDEFQECFAGLPVDVTTDLTWSAIRGAAAMTPD